MSLVKSLRACLLGKLQPSSVISNLGHRVKTHKITPAADNERGDIEIQDYIFLPHGEDDRIPLRTLVMDVTMTHDRYGRTTQHTNGELTHRVPSCGVLSTSGRVYEDFARLLFLHTHREASILAGELPEESEQFRFLRASRLSNLKGSVGLILTKSSSIRVTIPIDLSTSPFIPLPRFLNSRRVPSLVNQSLVLIPQQSV